MGLKKALKKSFDQVLEAVRSLNKNKKNSKKLKQEYYESLTKQLKELEKHSGKSLGSVTTQLESLSRQVEAGNENIPLNVFDSLKQEVGLHQVELARHLDDLRETISSTPMPELSRQADVFDQLKSLTTSISRHNMAIEDLIESLEETNEDQQSLVDDVKDLLKRQKDFRLASLEDENDALLALALSYQDQLSLLEGAAQSDPVWGHQFELVRQKMTAPLENAGLFVVDEANVPVNYDLHEVIERVDTTDPALHFCVAEVYTPGYVFNNKVLRKAKISAYALTEIKVADTEANAEDAFLPAADSIPDAPADFWKFGNDFTVPVAADLTDTEEDEKCRAEPPVRVADDPIDDEENDNEAVVPDASADDEGWDSDDDESVPNVIPEALTDAEKPAEDTESAGMQNVTEAITDSVAEEVAKPKENSDDIKTVAAYTTDIDDTYAPDDLPDVETLLKGLEGNDGDFLPDI
ncbi:MAG: nucleotide exchange factor GrpE [Clostridia bacterium]|nr:nucleotide exchange factor GrpE [Clostridia bacterium]